ncbi:signal-regulatory protein beta-1-like isoform X3 [Lepidochelys kempii]|uniref:signal-regulatory protein beta-1-like isoform X3 n=1 Tax=Lepidochelys kempii TaxID=8472 RepID=UPI003C6F64AD
MRFCPCPGSPAHAQRTAPWSLPAPGSRGGALGTRLWGQPAGVAVELHKVAPQGAEAPPPGQGPALGRAGVRIHPAVPGAWGSAPCCCGAGACEPASPSLACSLLPGAGGAEEFQLLQPQDAVRVSAGETLTLTCSVTGLAPVGPVQWFKGSGGDRQLVYAQAGSFPRVTRAVSVSDTDFTIRISDTRPADAGTYRCVKFKKGAGGEEEFRSGAGTAVTVSASPSAPSVSGPSSRAEPGPSVTFTCTSGGFSPRDITVTWLKNGTKLPAPQPQVLPEHKSVSYNMSSTVGLSLTRGDVRSQLTCQIEHSTLPAPLRGSYNLREALRGKGEFL